MGALTDGEYEKEKARVLGGHAATGHDGTPNESVSREDISTDGVALPAGLRGAWAQSSFAQNKPLVIAGVITATLLIGIVLRSPLLAGLILAAGSAGVYWLYTGLRIEQRGAQGDGLALWRTLFYLGCGLIVISFFVGGRSHRADPPQMEAADEQVQSANAPSAEDQTKALIAPKAVLTCRGGGSVSMPVSACFAASHDQGDGQLKVSSGGKTVQFADADIMLQLGGETATIPLTEPFEIFAQTNGDDGFVLHLEIVAGGRTVFQDEASSFGVIRVDSNNLR